MSSSEAIVGRDFLPRGSGIVTRRPLELQLITVSNLDTVPLQLRASFTPPSASSSAPAPAQPVPLSFSNPSAAAASTASASATPSSGADAPVGLAGAPEWAEFSHRKGRFYTDFDEVRDEIQAETDRLLGKNKAVSADPIRLKIFSPNVLTLTLIDLPGITKVPVGDQPADIEQQLGEMVHAYIANPHCIILAVSAANQDLANSDALKLARVVDPYGMRTLGVLTKVDLMDNGTDALDILLGKVYPLKLGFVAVVNRSQQCINERKPIAEALRNEAAFFQRHAAYRVLAHRLGTPFLSRSLNQILMNHIKDCLPDIKNRIAQQMMEIEHELASFGDPLQGGAVEGGKTSQGALVLQLVSKFCSNFCDAIDGRLQEVYGGMAELYGGARISYTFHELFAAALEQIDPFDRLSDQDIRTAIRNATGPRPSLFVPEISFDLLVKRQILRLEEPAQQCCELVFDELLQVAAQCDPPELTRFAHLREKVIEVVSSLLRRRLQPTKVMITNLVQIELAYINTNHPDFIGGARAVTQLAEQGRNGGNAATGSNGGGGGGAGSANAYQQQQQTRQQSSSSSSAFATATGAAGQHPAQALNTAMQQQQAAAAGKKAAAAAAASSTFQGAHDLSEVDSNGFMQSLLARFSRTGGAGNRGGAATAASSSSSAQASAAVVDDDLEDEPNSLNASFAAHQQQQQYMPTVREKVETSIIKTLITSYFNIVRKTVQDVVPKTIMCLLVNASKAELQSELVSALYREDLFPVLLREREDVAERRAAAEAVLQTLKRAMAVTNEIRDFSPTQVTAATTAASAAAVAAVAIGSPRFSRAAH